MESFSLFELGNGDKCIELLIDIKTVDSVNII